ncbi:MAG: hypothetical protein AB9869_01190 [Verrucomicrobiia bacterium]
MDKDQAVKLLLALSDPNLPDRDAAWEGVKVALGLYATDPARAIKLIERMRKLID